ncbi:hypothetical protein TCAL_07500 [Tigriopus californicus]|uniref:Ig-like domain-containing protein n=1 Tax=Tigriopus californicus TaxID=6832 RepID=A0A553PD65_TIGCA|nr:zwei Ig domain protein zig-8-like isoform X2 [Tigriopus californicus]TRY75614.1 hypothetical protein TCAL_07500 [Tigriopus californicus]
MKLRDLGTIMNQLPLILLLFPVVLSSTNHKEPFLLENHPSGFYLPDEPAEPEFADSETNITAQLEGSIFLHCPVVNSGDRAISWIRLRDWHILTNGVQTYTSDDRFSILHKEGSFDWILQIKYVQERDAGVYECQVSTNSGTISRKVFLNVVSPVAFILGGDEYHIDRGSQISLVCVIEKAPTAPQFVFWFHNDRMVNYDQERGITVYTSHSPEKTQSRFNIQHASPSDSGNYTCKPSNAIPASIQVFVSKSRVDKMEALHKQSSLLINTPVDTSQGTRTVFPSGLHLLPILWGCFLVRPQLL